MWPQVSWPLSAFGKVSIGSKAKIQHIVLHTATDFNKKFIKARKYERDSGGVGRIKNRYTLIICYCLNIKIDRDAV